MDFPFKIKKCESQKNLEFKFSVSLVLLYFLVLFPGIQILLRGHPWILQYGYLLFFMMVVTYLGWGGEISISRLGFSRQNLENHLIVGLVAGGLVLIALPILDVLISILGLDKNELFAESVKLRVGDDVESLHPVNLLWQVLLFPIMKQFILTSLIYPSLSRRFNPILAVYATAVIFTLAQLQLNLGVFALGLITAFLFQLTGTLYASILFHASCSLAGLLLLNVYPRLTTLLVFIF